MRPDLSAGHQPLSPVPPSATIGTVASPSVSESLRLTAPGGEGSERLRGGQAMADHSSDKGNAPVPAVGRRSAPRLRLSLPAQLIAVEKAHTCILLNLSRSGAQVAILESMREGEGAILRCGMIDHFAIVTRSEFGLNALEFDEPLTDQIVLETRLYHENFEARERRALIETARKWVTGETGDDRSI